VLNRLDVLSRRAEELGQISAAARCEELIGKARGMFLDRSVSTVWNGDIKALTNEQLDKLISQLREVAGSDNPSDEDCRADALLPSGDEGNGLTPDKSTDLLPA
jgi:hypothetical protein